MYPCTEGGREKIVLLSGIEQYIPLICIPTGGRAREDNTSKWNRTVHSSDIYPCTEGGREKIVLLSGIEQ
jgi:hypothetical protein